MQSRAESGLEFREPCGGRKCGEIRNGRAEFPWPAPASCRFANGNTIKVNYSSPRKRGRKIYGGLVPYNKVWRLGANEATTFDISTDATIDGKKVPKGNYTLFAIPRPGNWALIISKKTGE